MKANRFSVIVPVYNTQRFLKVCVDSILGQTYGFFELILVDDGSTDESGSLCDGYAGKYPSKVSVIHKKNEGLISARRAGLRTANGEYICFVDSDDYIRKDTLEKVSQIIDRYQADMVVYPLQQVDVAGEDSQKTSPFLFGEGLIEKENFFKRVISLDLNSLCCKICRYSLFDVERDYSKWYGISRGEDLLQSLPIIYKAKKIYYLPETFYYYRENSESIIHTYRKGQHHELDVILPLLYTCMEKLGYDCAENVKMFYKSYLEILWGNLCMYSRSDIKPKAYKAHFSDAIGFGYTQKAKEYMQKADCWSMFSRRTAIGLRLFYHKRWNTLIGYLKVWDMANHLREIIKEI